MHPFKGVVQVALPFFGIAESKSLDQSFIELQLVLHEMTQEFMGISKSCNGLHTRSSYFSIERNAIQFFLRGSIVSSASPFSNPLYPPETGLPEL